MDFIVTEKVRKSSNLSDVFMDGPFLTWKVYLLNFLYSIRMENWDLIRFPISRYKDKFDICYGSSLISI